jgi:hypothetical protein
MWLTTIPCIDVPQDNTMHKIELSKQNQDNRHQDDSDHCSPFCTCNCCQSNFEITSNIISVPAMALEINYYYQSAGLQSPVLFDFQVPPKA